MAQFVRTRVRCVIYLGKVGTMFLTQDGGNTPKIFKGAGAEFEFLLVVDKDTPYDVGNIASLTLMAKLAGQPTTAPVMLKTTAAIVNVASMDTWNAGSEQHAVIVFSGVETNVAAGPYDLTLYGLTTDDGLDTDVFGTSQLQIIDAGLTNTVAPPVGTSPGVTAEQLAGLLNQYVKAVMNPGQTLTFTSPNGHIRRTLGVGDNYERPDDLEDV